MIDRNIRSDWGKLDYLLAVQRNHEYEIELKYSKKDEPTAEIAAKRQQALEQLKAYSQDSALPSLTVGTPTHCLYIRNQDFDQIACEEVGVSDL